MPHKYIKGAKVKWPEWAEPDDPQIAALMNQAVNEANVMILTEMGSEPNMARDPATGQGMPTRTLKREKPGRYSINISGGRQYIDIYAQELGEAVAGVDPALEQRMIRKPVIVWQLYESRFDFVGWYFTIETGFEQRQWWYEHDQEKYDSRPSNKLFVSGTNQVAWKGLFGIPPDTKFVPEGLPQLYPYSIWNYMPLVANLHGGYGLFDGDYTYDGYNETTYSPPGDPVPATHWIDTCMSGRKDGTSIATSYCGTCPDGGECHGLTHMWFDAYDIIPCPVPGSWPPQHFEFHTMGNTLFCVSNCQCGPGAVVYCCRSGRWEHYGNDCFMCGFCTTEWSTWHEGSCACEDICPGSTYWIKKSRGGSGNDWIFMKRDYADSGGIIHNVVATGGVWSASSYASAGDMCKVTSCSVSSTYSSAYSYPWMVWDGSTALMADYVTSKGEEWKKYDRWMLLYTVEQDFTSSSGSACWDNHTCCYTCPDPEPGPMPPPNPKDLFIVIDNGEPGGAPGEHVHLETITAYEDVWGRTMKIYDCLGDPLYLFAYRVEDCDNEQNWFRYGLYYQGELTLTEKFTADQDCVSDYYCDLGDFCQAHTLEGAYEGEHGYAYGFVSAMFWDLYTWDRHTLDPGGAFPVNPKFSVAPQED